MSLKKKLRRTTFYFGITFIPRSENPYLLNPCGSDYFDKKGSECRAGCSEYQDCLKKYGGQNDRKH